MKASKASVSVVMSARAGARARPPRRGRTVAADARAERADARGGGAHGADDARRRVRMEDERRADPKRNEYKVIVTITK